MGKVKLTQEQADMLEELKKHYAHEQILITNIRGRLQNEHFNYTHMKLAEESVDSLIKALYIGYEVEPEIKIGDFVDIGLFGVSKIAEVTDVKGNAIAINGSDEYHEFKINRVLTDNEKQEEKQRRWWAKNDREEWEIREDDILEHLGNPYIVDCFDSEAIWFRRNKDSRTDYSELVSFVRDHFKVVCFAEDRKDIDHD